MLEMKSLFGSFSVDDLAAAKQFYSETLGLAVTEDDEMGTLGVEWGGELRLFIYPKPDHQPATFTVLNLAVDDVEKAVDDLNARGVTTKIYGDDELEGMPNDEKGIVRGVENIPEIAWFKDPAGNVLAVISSRDFG